MSKENFDPKEFMKLLMKAMNAMEQRLDGKLNNIKESQSKETEKILDVLKQEIKESQSKETEKILGVLKQYEIKTEKHEQIFKHIKDKMSEE